jgi:hypothetical protein
MSDLFIWIYLDGRGREIHETLWGGGAQTMKVWEPVPYRKEKCHICVVYLDLYVFK